jgi:hypothetical protein
MYFVAQISPLEWKKASVCNHYNHDDDINDTEFYHHSLNSIDGHEDFMANREMTMERCNVELEEKRSESNRKRKEEERGEGNCSENYSTLEQHQQYFKNMCVMNEENDLENIWMNMEYRRNFINEQRARHNHEQQQSSSEIGSSKQHFDENLDINDDGLIGCDDEDSSFRTYDEMQHM